MTSPTGRQRKSLLLGLLALLAAGPCLAAVTLTSFSGSVQTRKKGIARWYLVDTVPVTLSDGDSVRTSAKSAAVLLYPDGSRLGVSPNAALDIEESSPQSMAARLILGAVRAVIAHIPSRRFEIRTPTAICAVRGTEFRVEVLSGGTTLIDLYKGLLAVEDKRGQQVLMRPNERIQVDLKSGLGERNLSPATQRQARHENFHEEMRRELAFDIGRRQIQAAAVRELRQADYEQGKSLINAFGDRVRVEEYIIRPTPSSFKLVVLNDSKQEGFNYFYYLGQFNTTLPTDLSVALRQLPGTVGTAPTYYLTSIQNATSNGTDSVTEIANGGHPVNVNSGVDPTEAVTSYFNTATNSYVPIASGQAFYQTLFNNEGLYVDGTLKSGWTGTNIQTYNLGYNSASPVPVSTLDPITGASLPAAVISALSIGSTTNSTFPNSNQIHQTVLTSYGDGTFLQYDNYIINNNGQVAAPSDFGSTSGTSFIQQLLNFNYEEVITASEFGGRKIDLVVAPKMLVESGLAQ